MLIISLSREQRRIVAEELQVHFETSTLSVQMIAEKLNVTTKDVEKVLAITVPLGISSHQLQRSIHLVWDVRDVINDNIKENGQTLEPCMYLKGKKGGYRFLR